MIDCAHFFARLTEAKVSFFTGVPDSLLKEICAYITDQVPSEAHLIAPNEGNAVALAAGHHLATGGLPLVYMQNSGLGNAINPLTSLTDELVYGIPMLLLIGWRGQPGVNDEPQHRKMGLITRELLTVLGIASVELSTEPEVADRQIAAAARAARQELKPYALLVAAGTFSPYALTGRGGPRNGLGREESLGLVLGAGPGDSLWVATTGKLARELYALRGGHHAADFLVVGSMGHASQIALGLALGRPERTVVCLDGDGAVLMHMGSLASLGTTACPNLRHVVFNNWAHESVGGQPTVAGQIDLPAIARACGYRTTSRAHDRRELEAGLAPFFASPAPALLEIFVELGARADLPRPRSSPRENKESFMDAL